jgi:hypothetical protein
MRNMNSTIGRAVAMFGIGLAACARDSVSLGDGNLVEPLIPSERCAINPLIDGGVRVTEQAELDAIAGCEEISGDLAIEVFPGTDLRPLASLRAVGGELSIGDRSSTLVGDAYLGLIEAGWLESFDGVQALERVGALTLLNFAASDLSPFSSLRYVNAATAPGGVRSGHLSVEGAKNVVSFRGLEQVGGIESMTLFDLPALESLEGLTLRDRFDSIMLQKTPSLTNIDALAPLERGNVLAIIETGLADLRSLSSLINVESFQINDNPLLADATSIPSPASIFFSLTGSPRLRGTLELHPSSTSSGVSIGDNPELERISFDDPELHSIPWTCGGFTIFRNAKLRAVTSPNGCDQLDRVEVLDNGSLEALDLGRLKRLDELHIRDNPGLFALSHAEFERIYVVDVVNNPALSTRSLASVPAFERTLEGNAD